MISREQQPAAASNTAGTLLLRPCKSEEVLNDVVSANDSVMPILEEMSHSFERDLANYPASHVRRERGWEKRASYEEIRDVWDGLDLSTLRRSTGAAAA